MLINISDPDMEDQFKEQYPLINQEFSRIQEEERELFIRKMISYGRGNIALGSNLEKDQDVDLALMGIWIRMQDKMNRLKNLLFNKQLNTLTDEAIEDTLMDLSNYANIALIVYQRNW